MLRSLFLYVEINFTDNKKGIEISIPFLLSAICAMLFIF